MSPLDDPAGDGITGGSPLPATRVDGPGEVTIWGNGKPVTVPGIIGLVTTDVTVPISLLQLTGERPVSLHETRSRTKDNTTLTLRAA